LVQKETTETIQIQTSKLIEGGMEKGKIELEAKDTPDLHILM
jgi:hypothetical protein